MANNIKLKSFVMKSGERYCLLVNSESGMPLYFPNLFVTTQVRNRSLSYASMEKTLVCIAVLLNYMADRNEDLEVRFRKKQFFEIHELDAIRDYSQRKFSATNLADKTNGVLGFKKMKAAKQIVNSQTEYSRLTVIAHYIKWLAVNLTGENREKHLSLKINQMVRGLEARRPPKRDRNNGLVDKGLDETQTSILFELFKPESSINPFCDNSTQVRNQLMFFILYYLGLRRGELLNIRIKDIDFNSNQLVIVRRADEEDDTRTHQPKAKTLDRRLPMADTLVKEISNYIIHHRKLVTRPRQEDYLFVTHKNCSTKGLPISISGFKKVIKSASNVSPKLINLTAHALRHHWNERFSKEMDDNPNPQSKELQEETRSHLMGWTQGSGTAATYNKRFIKYKAFEASLNLQKSMARLPKGLMK